MWDRKVLRDFSIPLCSDKVLSEQCEIESCALVSVLKLMKLVLSEQCEIERQGILRDREGW